MTIHASHYVDVISNVAVDHIGHCYFLEDSAEKDTWFEGNLGMGTRVGYLTEGDKEPSTFWITTPITTMINNVAAGSNRSGKTCLYKHKNRKGGIRKTITFFLFVQNVGYLPKLRKMDIVDIY